ncbi:hypothetical protein cyc_06946 [Cyclospora cayetanensis]|uniref:Uncharacterized protein n=1 Tax=Cyclospora cayetanensis TaxID=88456 RepID=A0A1D3D032_9EIME|nr:hypothetical protein cyc_06946 [Cyclospora cayetanensis]
MPSEARGTTEPQNDTRAKRSFCGAPRQGGSDLSLGSGVSPRGSSRDNRTARGKVLWKQVAKQEEIERATSVSTRKRL